MSIVAYADGGCSPTNPGPGGWGVVIDTPGGRIEMRGGEADTTNNRMELTAAIRALEHFPAGTAMEMRCDSQYVVKSASEWIPGWKRKGWRTATGDVKNVDLMKRLDTLNAERSVRWTWVRGHAGDAMNERADALVHVGRREAAAGMTESGAVQVATPALPRIDPAQIFAADGAAPERTGAVAINLALGLEVSRAAKAAGLPPRAIVEDAIRLALVLGLPEVRRLLSTKAT